MTGKAKTLTAGGVMLAVQAVVAWAAWLSAWCMARNWSEGLGSVALPLPTDIALRHAFVIPTVSAVLAVIVVALALFAVAITMSLRGQSDKEEISCFKNLVRLRADAIRLAILQSNHWHSLSTMAPF